MILTEAAREPDGKEEAIEKLRDYGAVVIETDFHLKKSRTVHEEMQRGIRFDTRISTRIRDRILIDLAALVRRFRPAKKINFLNYCLMKWPRKIP